MVNYTRIPWGRRRLYLWDLMEAAQLAPMMILKHCQDVKYGSSTPELLVHFASHCYPWDRGRTREGTFSPHWLRFVLCPGLLKRARTYPNHQERGSSSLPSSSPLRGKGLKRSRSLLSPRRDHAQRLDDIEVVGDTALFCHLPKARTKSQGHIPRSRSLSLFQLNQQRMSFSGPRDLRSVLHWRQVHRLACLELCFHALAIR